jgi:hypothetical protein
MKLTVVIIHHQDGTGEQTLQMPENRDRIDEFVHQTPGVKYFDSASFCACEKLPQILNATTANGYVPAASPLATAFPRQGTHRRIAVNAPSAKPTDSSR